ncbi:MAG: hypothetical protein N4A61_04750 [Pelagimonas sp.]|jgi:hypothetical protein|nr:hypothetical protein [Pelagimonas sp.]
MFDTSPPDPRLQETIDQLRAVPPELGLALLQRLVLDEGGLWGIPEENEYRPAYYEVQVLGVFAFDPDRFMVPHNWCVAASRVLKGEPPLTPLPSQRRSPAELLAIRARNNLCQRLGHPQEGCNR